MKMAFNAMELEGIPCLVHPLNTPFKVFMFFPHNKCYVPSILNSRSRDLPPVSRSNPLQTLSSSPELSLGSNLPGLDSLHHKDTSTNQFHSILWNSLNIRILCFIFERVFLWQYLP